MQNYILPIFFRIKNRLYSDFVARSQGMVVPKVSTNDCREGYYFVQK